MSPGQWQTRHFWLATPTYGYWSTEPFASGPCEMSKTMLLDVLMRYQPGSQIHPSRVGSEDAEAGTAVSSSAAQAVNRAARRRMRRAAG
ncbi:hypothetical protein A8W25_15635 [Streptomyces sp. ERV7]|nr:hypothetical protein A8W25_15635 [Streptomyces sp. ERV7]